jgi:hypothetical protein
MYRAKTNMTHTQQSQITAKKRSIQNSQIFFMTLWSLVSSSQRFDRSWLLHLQGQWPFDPEGEGATTGLIVRTADPPTQRRITEDLNFRQQRSENLKSRIVLLCSSGYIRLLFSQVTLLYRQVLPNILTSVSFRPATPLLTHMSNLL